VYIEQIPQASTCVVILDITGAVADPTWLPAASLPPTLVLGSCSTNSWSFPADSLLVPGTL
jgi:hypothetical protein